MAGTRTGLPTLAKLLEHVCRIITRYGPLAKQALDVAAAGGAISVGDANTAKAFIDAASGTCDIFKRASGY